MLLTLNKAAQTCGHAKSTLLDAIRSGRLSAPKDDRGRYAIDPAELHRVFPFQMPDRTENRLREPQPTPRRNHPTTSPDPRTEVLAREVELLREALARSEENAERWRAMAERQQAFLEDRRQANEARERPKPKGLLQRLLRR